MKLKLNGAMNSAQRARAKRIGAWVASAFLSWLSLMSAITGAYWMLTDTDFPLGSINLLTSILLAYSAIGIAVCLLRRKD